eukprot:GHVT01066107.1.p1 GENE.GHVT01066107.1~~GHVT01066107.1.p1  ORF type:complete len:873 (+),score=45.81 GHVT01066107.1:5077-7695(+)
MEAPPLRIRGRSPAPNPVGCVTPRSPTGHSTEMEFPTLRPPAPSIHRCVVAADISNSQFPENRSQEIGCGPNPIGCVTPRSLTGHSTEMEFPTLRPPAPSIHRCVVAADISNSQFPENRSQEIGCDSSTSRQIVDPEIRSRLATRRVWDRWAYIAIRVCIFMYTLSWPVTMQGKVGESGPTPESQHSAEVEDSGDVLPLSHASDDDDASVERQEVQHQHRRRSHRMHQSEPTRCWASPWCYDDRRTNLQRPLCAIVSQTFVGLSTIFGSIVVIMLSIWQNDWDDINWWISDKFLGYEAPVAQLLWIVYLVLTVYVSVVFCCGTVLVATRRLFRVSTLHAVICGLLIIICIVEIVVFAILWEEEYQLIGLWLQLWNPFLHIAAIAVYSLWLGFALFVQLAKSRKAVQLEDFYSEEENLQSSPCSPVASVSPSAGVPPTFASSSDSLLHSGTASAVSPHDPTPRSPGVDSSPFSMASATLSPCGDSSIVFPPEIQVNASSSGLSSSAERSTLPFVSPLAPSRWSEAPLWCRSALQWIGISVAFGAWIVLLIIPFCVEFTSPCLLRQPYLPRPTFGPESPPQPKGAHSWLPPKPFLVGHRGVPQIAPENTRISYEISNELGCAGLESDVQFSSDGVPFLMHDTTLERTTDVSHIFPGRTHDFAWTFSWAEVEQLNAGKWFSSSPPPGSQKFELSDEECRAIDTQTVPPLSWLLEFSSVHNRILIFDLKCPPCEYSPSACGGKCLDRITDLVEQVPGVTKTLWWYFGNRAEVRRRFPEMRFVTYPTEKWLEKGDKDEYTDVVNSQAAVTQASIVRHWSEIGYWVNLWTVSKPWLLTYYWCAGAHSVTTNSCQDLSHLDSPLWHMSLSSFQGKTYVT